MSELLERHIIELLREKDEKAISLLYEHYSDAMYGVIFKVLKNEDLAQDALQESFVKVWKNSDQYDPSKAKLFTWLFRICRNTAIDKYRSESNKADREIQIDSSDVYTRGEDRIRPEEIDVMERVGDLDEKYRVVLEALFFEGMTQQEASEKLEMPLGTIKTRLKIGLRELRKVYGALAAWIVLLITHF